MSKHSAQDSANLGKAPNFAEFWRIVASELGSSRLKINMHAHSINQFIDGASDHKDYLRSAIQESYKRSRCHHLKDTISVDAVLDILGETAYALQGQQADDLMDIELLEEVAWLIDERYRGLLNIDKKARSQGGEGRVISLIDTRIRRANSRL